MYRVTKEDFKSGTLPPPFVRGLGALDGLDFVGNVRLDYARVRARKDAIIRGFSGEGPIASLDLPPGQAVTLKPGGEHIMLMGLNGPLREGQSFPLTLTFEKAGAREVTVAIEKPGANGPPPQR